MRTCTPEIQKHPENMNTLRRSVIVEACVWQYFTADDRERPVSYCKHLRWATKWSYLHAIPTPHTRTRPAAIRAESSKHDNILIHNTRPSITSEPSTPCLASAQCDNTVGTSRRTTKNSTYPPALPSSAYPPSCGP